MHSSADSIDPCRPYEEWPEEIWIEIFVRSSVESLLRVRCVCTRWLALVDSPSFIKKHHQFQKMTSEDKGGFLLLRHYHRDNKKANYFLFDEESIASGATSSSYCSLAHPCLHNSFCCGPLVRIEGPVNGLYCVYNGADRFVIWNPATNEVGFLPFPEECLSVGDDSSSTIFNIGRGVIGFGTDPLNAEDYKVLLICVYDTDDDDDDDYFCRMLYTSNTNTWRLVEDDDFIGSGNPYHYSSNNAYLNGFYYWLTTSRKVALAFDMGKESFRKISTPNIYSEDTQCCGEIALHEDQIALFIVKKNLGEIDIWVLMVDDNIWMRKMSVVTGIRGVEKSLGFWKKDEQLLLVIDDSEGHLHGHVNSQTVVYNTITREIVNIGPRGWITVFQATFYYESLVSLSGRITKYKGNHSSVLDTVSWFLHGD